MQDDARKAGLRCNLRGRKSPIWRMASTLLNVQLRNLFSIQWHKSKAKVLFFFESFLDVKVITLKEVISSLWMKAG